MRLFSLPRPLLLFRPLSTSTSNPNPNPNSPPKWPLYLPRPISTPHHLHQLLSRAVVSGLLRPPYLALWNSLVHSLARGPSPSLALSLFLLIRALGISPDSYTFTSALKASSRVSLLKTGEEIHALSIKLGFNSDTFVLNSLINMYSVCGFVSTARKVFDSAAENARDVVSWNSMISGYLQSNLSEAALWVFVKMVRESVVMDEVTPVNALIACGRTGAIDLGRRIHALVVVNGFDLNYYLGSSLVSMYAKCGLVEDAWNVFDEMPDWNVVSWTSIIAGFAQSGRFKEAVELFREMQITGVKADDATIASVVSSCAQMGALDLGKYVCAYCDIHGIGKELSVKNALIDMYSKCGDIERAYEIFDGLANRDVFSWTVMISGLAMNGYCKDALDLFERMEKKCEVRPNEVTFLGVLSACSHGGFVDKGYYYFDHMTKFYMLTPKIEHYGCMVDLLGRAKHLAEADRFIKAMPIIPDVVIWRSLLFACRAVGEVKLAEYAAERIIDLEPNKCGGHVLLSNVYATTSRWSEVNRVRRVMNKWRINKQPGCSFIEVNGTVYEFFAADTSHHESEAIYEVLWGINKLLI